MKASEFDKKFDAGGPHVGHQGSDRRVAELRR